MDDSAKLAQFIDVTGASQEAAKFFLESSGGQVDTAVDQYFATGGAFEAPEGIGVQQTPLAPDYHQAEDEQPQQPVVHPPATNAPVPAPPAAAVGTAGGSSSRPSRPAASRGNVRSLADLGAGEPDTEDDDEHNEYYAGGEKSGQVVKGAPKKQREHMDDLFERARMAGATDGPAHVPLTAGRGAGSAFSGTGRSLGSGDAVQVPTPAAAATGGQPQRLVHNVTFYTNGVFTVDDGEARHLNDPANRAFLDSIARGECPSELEPANRGAEVNVNLVRSERDYVAPDKPRYKAFAGTGRVLSADDQPSNSAAPKSSSAQPAASAAAASSSTPWEGPDESKDMTSIQLRLADGSRMVARFNLTQTVGDIRRFIRASRPDSPRTYSLITAFPQAQLKDDSATIASAGLANAVIIQKL